MRKITGPGDPRRRPAAARWTRRDILVAGASAAAAVSLRAPRVGHAAPADTPNARLGVGVIGLGARGGVLLEALLRVPGAATVALCDLEVGPRERAAARVAAAGGEARTYEDHRQLLEDPRVDAVVDATPTAVHPVTFAAALEAGKHLYGEPPVAPSGAQADALVELARARPEVRFQVGLTYRATARWIEAVKLVREDQVLGELVDAHVRVRLGHAVNTWDLLNWLLGAVPRRAFGLAPVRGAPRPGGLRHACGLLEYPGGRFVQFSAADAPAVHARLVGRRSVLEFDGGHVAFHGYRAGPSGEGRSPLARLLQPASDSTADAVRAFVHSVRTDATPPATLYHGRDATLAGLLVRRAASEGREVPWAEIAGRSE
jgi:predicted dehydrogenase